MSVTEYELVTYTVYTQYILKLLCRYLYHLYHPTFSVLTLRQRSDICTTQHKHKHKRETFQNFTRIFLKGSGENI